MAALKYFLVYLKIGSNEWMDAPARAATERDAIQNVLNRRRWTQGHISITSKPTGDYAQVTLAKRDPMTGEYQPMGGPRIYHLKYKA